MTLSFSLHFGGVAMNFPEKIIKSLEAEPITPEIAKYIHSEYYAGDNVLRHCKPKIHTIRKDDKNRWKVGNKIHAVINNRTSKRLQFIQTLSVLSIQKIKIRYHFAGSMTTAKVYIDNNFIGEAIWVNCRLINSSYTVDLLATNDGFETTNQFFEYFDESLDGKIIHWTEYQYC